MQKQRRMTQREATIVAALFMRYLTYELEAAAACDDNVVLTQQGREWGTLTRTSTAWADLQEQVQATSRDDQAELLTTLNRRSRTKTGKPRGRPRKEVMQLV